MGSGTRWGSPRFRAHNPEVVGSNPTPALLALWAVTPLETGHQSSINLSRFAWKAKMSR